MMHTGKRITCVAWVAAILAAVAPGSQSTAWAAASQSAQKTEDAQKTEQKSKQNDSQVGGASATSAEPQVKKADSPASEGASSTNPAAPASAKPDAKLPPMVGGAPLDPKSYIIGPEDVLAIRVWREPELSGQFPVRPDGHISLPLIGDTKAAGLTPQQLGSSLAESLMKFMNRPEVTVGVQQVNSKKYFIQGEVQKPGSYPLTIPTTVLEALSNAGGFRDFANTKKIVILRGSERFKFNYK